MSVSSHTTSEAASLLEPFNLPVAIYGEGFIGMKRDHYDRLKAALQKIDAMDWEANEWDAVEKYRDCQRIAKKALSDEPVTGEQR